MKPSVFQSAWPPGASDTSPDPMPRKLDWIIDTIIPSASEVVK